MDLIPSLALQQVDLPLSIILAVSKLITKGLHMCNSKIGDGVADRHLDQEEGLDAGELGGWGQVLTG